MTMKTSRTAKNTWMGALFFALVLLLPVSVMAEQPSSIRLNYDLYAGGMHALNATMDVGMGQDSYIIDVEAEVRGFMRHILPWKGSLVSHGRKEGKGFVPQKHERISAWPDEVKRTILEYDKKGQLLTSRAVIVEDEKVTKYPNDMDKQAAMHAVDLLTASMHMMNAGAHDTKPCDQSIPVYDGKRRFDLVFKRVGTENLTRSRYNNYEGEALKCTFEMDMASEKDRRENQFYKTQEKSKAKGRTPTIWLGKISKSGLYIPVKMQIHSDYGSLLVHLKSAALLPIQHATAE